MTVSEAILSREFFLMSIAFAFNQLSGLHIVSKIQTITIVQFGKSSADAVNLNAAFGVFNVIGRLILSAVSDCFGRKTIFIVMHISQAIAVGFMPQFIIIQQYGLFALTVLVIAFMFGGGPGIVPAFDADNFSSKHTGPTFG